MVKRSTRLAVIGATALGLLVGFSGCEREARRFAAAPRPPDARAQAESLSQQQAGPAGPGMREAAAAGGYAEDNAYTLAQGKLYYRWFNCVGCHAQGGGGIGPALMDASWIYGKEPGDVFTTIMDGRPNGMPSFRGRLPEQQAWQLVAYVRSLSGLVSGDAATNRGDTLAGGQPEYLRDPLPPEDKKR
ncbi:MAG: c-type cytochrome [Burkholderiales bacterium]|nr:c-type cytochrome [Burkholderiales bacterium]